MPVLYTTPRSANGRKPLLLVHHLGLAVEIEEVDVYTGAGQHPGYLAINPSGQVPTLVEGDLVLTESNAILIHLAEVHGAGALCPRGPGARAGMLSWMFWEASQWQPALIPVLSAHVGHRLLPDAVAAPEAPPDWQEPKLARCLSWLEQRLEQRPFLCGDELSLADLSVAGMTTYFACTGFPAADHPAVAAWQTRIESLPAWQATACAPFA